MRKLAIMVSVAMAALLTMSVGAVSSATADPYAPVPKPHCFIRVLHAEPGERIVIEVGARLNAADQPSGTITVRLRTRPATGDKVWTTSVHTDGKPVRLTGPVVPEGTHRITTRFTPDDPMESRGCRGAQGVDVSDTDDDDDDDGDGDNGGFLPDTGGPAQLWLLVGLILVASGAGIVVYSRRRAQVQVPAH